MSARIAYRVPDAATLASLVLYAALCALIIVTAVAGLGWLDRPVHSIAELSVPGYMERSTLGFYDKSELRLTLSVMVALSVALTLVFVLLTGLRHKAVRLHPAHAVFAIVLFFAAAPLPPYEVNLSHWSPMVAAATGIRHGVWPYFSGYDSGYGLLAPAALALWLAAFGVSELSLTAMISACTLIAGGASFALMRKLTGSRAVALLGTAYLLLEATDAMAVTSTYRAPVQITLGALLLYESLRGGTRGIVAGALFGLVALWAPPFGAFAAVGYTCAHAWRIGQTRVPRRLAATLPLLAMIAGLAVPIAIIFTVRPAVHLANVLDALGSTGNLFLLGWGNLPQRLDLIVLPGFLLVVTYAGLVFRRLLRGRPLTRRYLFVGGALIAAIPWVIYATGRSDARHHLAAWWALLPCIALLAWGFVRLLALTPARNPASQPARLSLTVLCVVFVIWFPLYSFNQALGRYLTGYEEERARWYALCAQGKECNARDKPSLANYIRKEATPLSVERMGRDRALVEACRRGHAIVSYVDVWIYATGNCYSATGMPTVILINSLDELARYVAQLTTQPVIIFDSVPDIYAQWKGELLGEIKGQLLTRGFSETQGCGRFSILSNGTLPNPAWASLCD